MKELIESNPIFIIYLVTGVVFIAAGWLLKNRPPKFSNRFIGYRTRRSMRNQQSWDFAQKVSGLELMKWGGILWFLSITSFIVDLSIDIESIVACVMVIVITVLIIIRVERALKEQFKEG